MPLSKCTLALKVFALCGKTPFRKWIYQLLCRHADCALGRPVGLDPAHAKCFNGDGIPLRKLHNIDKIGCQIGGGHKDTGELYLLFATQDQSPYKIIIQGRASESLWANFPSH